MNSAIWILAGAALGWAAHARLQANLRLGPAISILIGVGGALFGGDVLAPMLGAAVEAAPDFNPFALVVALACAAGCLVISNLLSARCAA